jgi:hypothetical protein
VANWRGDVGVARPRAFSVFEAIAGSDGDALRAAQL